MRPRPLATPPATAARGVSDGTAKPRRPRRCAKPTTPAWSPDAPPQSGQRTRATGVGRRVDPDGRRLRHRCRRPTTSPWAGQFKEVRHERCCSLSAAGLPLNVANERARHLRASALGLSTATTGSVCPMSRCKVVKVDGRSRSCGGHGRLGGLLSVPAGSRRHGTVRREPMVCLCGRFRTLW